MPSLLVEGTMADVCFPPQGIDRDALGLFCSCAADQILRFTDRVCSTIYVGSFFCALHAQRGDEYRYQRHRRPGMEHTKREHAERKAIVTLGTSVVESSSAKVDSFITFYGLPFNGATTTGQWHPANPPTAFDRRQTSAIHRRCRF